MQQRYYDPEIGRFYSNDPIGFRDVHSFNRYACANNNPFKCIADANEASQNPNVEERLQCKRSFQAVIQLCEQLGKISPNINQ